VARLYDCRRRSVIVVPDYRVTDSGIVEIVFALSGNLIAEVPAETAEIIEDKTFFQEIQITLHSFHINHQFAGKLV
jgi:hypothetical protein